MLSDRCLPVCLSDSLYVSLLWANGWMGQRETWHGGIRPRPRPHCVRSGTGSPSKKGAQPSNFGPMSAVAKQLDGSRCHLGGRPRPRPHCVRWGSSSPNGKGHNSPTFRPMSILIVAKRSPISATAELLLQSLAPNIASLDRYGLV